MIYPENASLVDIISGLPGILDAISNINDRSDKEPIRIFFYVSENNNKGLFLLTRCTDRRYWQYGHLWKIELSIGDTYDKHLPIVYMLHSDEVVGDEAIEQAKDLVNNMNFHLNIENFLKHFKLDKNYFKKEFISNSRKNKLKRLSKYIAMRYNII